MSSKVPSASTPLAEIQHRAAVVRASLKASVPKLTVVSVELSGREKALAEESAQNYEQSGRDIMNVLGQTAKNMIVQDSLRARLVKLCYSCTRFTYSPQNLTERYTKIRICTRALPSRILQVGASVALWCLVVF